MKLFWHLSLATVLTLSVALCAAVMVSSASQILGDVNQNERLDSLDMRVMLQYMVGDYSMTAEQRLLADCDGNGRVDTLDTRYVLKVLTLDQTPSTIPTTTTTVATTTTTSPSLDDDGYYDDVIKP